MWRLRPPLLAARALHRGLLLHLLWLHLLLVLALGLVLLLELLLLPL